MVRRPNWSKKAALVTATLALAAVACGGGGPAPTATRAGGQAGGQTGGAIRLGVIVSQTGAGATIGVPFLEAVQAAIDDVNKAGGVNGSNVEAVVRDDETKPDVAVRHFEAFAREKVAFVLGPNLTATCYAVEPPSRQNKLPTYCLSSANLPQQFPYFFGADSDFNQVAAGHMKDFQAIGARSFAMLSSTDASGKLYTQTMTEAAAKAGIRITGTREFDPAESDLTSALVALREGRPDAYFIGTSGKPASIAFKNAKDLQIKEPVFAGFGNGTAAFAKLVGGEIPERAYVRMAKMGDPAALRPDDPSRKEIDAFTNAFKAKFNRDPDPVATGPWDATRVVLHTLKETKSTEPDTLVQFIEGLSWTGANCVYKFSKTDHRGSDPECLVPMQYAGNGAFKAVRFGG